MAFTPEIKNFIKNTIIFTLIFAVVIHFSWEYFSSLSGSSAQAHNNANFENANISYVGNSATALSLRIGGIIPQKNTNLSNNSVDNIISIAEVLNNPVAGQEKLIASNMTANTAYANILKTDIVASSFYIHHPKTYKNTAPSLGECGMLIISVRLILLLSLRILVFQVKQTCFSCMLLPLVGQMG